MYVWMCPRQVNIQVLIFSSNCIVFQVMGKNLTSFAIDIINNGIERNSCAGGPLVERPSTGQIRFRPAHEVSRHAGSKAYRC